MFKNQVIATLRNLKKNKVFAIINILGLVVGLTACLFIVQYVYFEWSYDNFHKSNPDLYRIRFDRLSDGKHDKSAGVTAFVGPALKDEFPEIKAYSKLWGTKHITNILSYNQENFISQHLYYADSAFLNLFSFQWIKGDPKTALANPYNIVLTESLAKKHFGNENPLGKQITYSGAYGKHSYKVTGILKDLPKNTHLVFDVLVSFKTLVVHTEGNAHDSRGWSAFPTYLLLHPNGDKAQMEDKLATFVNRNFEESKRHGITVRLLLQPVEDIHLTSDLRFESSVNGNGNTVKFLFIIALFILLLAWINYINLSTSRAIDRSKEVAIRKVAGASQYQLIIQFLVEAAVINLIAVAIALTAMQLLWPFFIQLVEKPIDIVIWTNIELQVGILCCFVSGVFLSGLYPAFVMSAYQPISILKPAKKKTAIWIDLRKLLVVFQFLISIVLIAGTITVYKQLNFMRSQSIGMNIGQTVVIKGAERNERLAPSFQKFKNTLMARADVKSLSNSTSVPGKEISWINNDVRWAKMPETDKNAMPHVGINAHFMQNFDMKILYGRNFSDSQDHQKNRVILTLSATKLLGFVHPSDALNEHIVDGDIYEVIGVAADYHHQSLSETLLPIIFRYLPSANTYYLVKLNGHDLHNSVAEIKQIFTKMFPGSPFTYFFLDDYYEQQYQADQQFGKVFSLFSLLAVVIASMGLFGLSSFTISRMAKEISIRKILGASDQNIFTMLSASFLKLGLIASCLALPIAYLGFGKWLQNYAFSIEIGWVILGIPILLIVFINFFTILFQTFQAARTNPIDALNAE